MLKIAPNLKLPDEAVTQTFAILAKRGVGKTYTASVMVEEMLKNNLPVVVLDPIGVWWGLRSSADGKKPGLSILIAGGDHADIPITPDNGEIMANLIIDDKLSVVIDFSHFRKGEQVKFVTDFAETLYHRNRTALHVVIDEADAFAPQRAMPNEARMLGAMEDIVRRGRARGIGVTMITQRPAVLNKNVLTQIEVLIAMRLTAPLDQKAIDEWVKTHAEEGQREKFMSALPSMPIGTAWFWSPGWLDIFKKVEVRRRETLDSSSTPKVGKLQVQAHSMADVNLDKIRQQLAATIEKVESEDPKFLKRRITELERELAAARSHPVVEVKKVPIVTDKIIEDLMRLFENFGKQPLVKALMDLRSTLEEVVNRPSEPVEAPPAIKNALRDLPPISENVRPMIATDGAPQPRPPVSMELSNYGRQLLETLRDRYPMKLTRAQISTLSGRKPRSSAFSAAMAEITRAGLINKVGDQFELTEAGHKLIGTATMPAQTSDQIQDMWRNALPPYERDLFNCLIEEYPKAVSRQELSELTGRSITSSAFHSSLSSLAKNELIEINNGEVRASDTLFV